MTRKERHQKELRETGHTVYQWYESIPETKDSHASAYYRMKIMIYMISILIGLLISSYRIGYSVGLDNINFVDTLFNVGYGFVLGLFLSIPGRIWLDHRKDWYE